VVTHARIPLENTALVDPVRCAGSASSAWSPPHRIQPSLCPTTAVTKFQRYNERSPSRRPRRLNSGGSGEGEGLDIGSGWLRQDQCRRRHPQACLAGAEIRRTAPFPSASGFAITRGAYCGSITGRSATKRPRLSLGPFSRRGTLIDRFKRRPAPLGSDARGPTPMSTSMTRRPKPNSV
jgi:hypothetical protein